ncbi:glycosyltransferase [Mesorhizobium sp. B2-6-1]|uniref:glycosyltransferase n=1 Tax=Mesorhizobium sp. B2-6-1 TaxID=2589916 RepID=UPI001FED8D2E|nr:glycosyltransferase [Mesorhizobium sp. B2-6-1]
MIKQGSRNFGTPCGVRIAVLSGYYDIPLDFHEVLEDGIDVREFDWIDFTAENVHIANAHSHRFVETLFDDYCVPEDGVKNLTDTDLWILISDRAPKPLAPIMPYVVFATDYIQRYVPEIMPRESFGKIDMPSIQTVRAANAVIVTTPHTKEDVISYVGVPAQKVHLAPMDFDPTVFPILADTKLDSDPYFIWPTNPTEHKNHIRAFDALQRYYEKLDGKLRAKIVGPNSLRMNPEHEIPEKILDIPYIKKLRGMIEASESLQQNIDFMGELSDAAYAQTLSGAQFLWHPTIIDNGTFAVAEAAWFRCPSLVSGYPQMHYIGNRFAIPMEFFNPRSVPEMAESLKEMETKAGRVRMALPSREDLSQHSWQRYAAEYWAMLKGIAP